MPKNVKIPKKIAGVKLPKKARKAANKAIEMGGNPVVREIAAAAIGAATAKAASKSERKPAREAETLRVRGSGNAQFDVGQIGEVIREAALDGLRRFFEGFDEGMRELSARAKAEAGDAKPGAATGRPGPGAGRG
ncbi:MAG: hypothetical protein JO276_10470 [Sphingomonadaceae bacterium]|nr:hypothetical protein [Sphingomonadaceae bacterium]